MNSQSIVRKRSRKEISTPVQDNVTAQQLATRDCTHLYAVTETVQCAVCKNCIPCAYKVATFDVALDREFCQEVPNQRPELCPRSIHPPIKKKNDSVCCDKDENILPLGYRCGLYVLTVGDGDFSFSVALARFGCRVVATSYESEETVRTVYSTVHVDNNINELMAFGAEIYYNVDATNLSGTLPTSAMKGNFQRVIWNFPCSAVAKGQDGQNIEMEKNKNLVRLFMKSAASICGGGQIHLNHKTKPPFNQWNIDEVAVSSTNNVRYVHRVVLDRNLFPPYTPRKALDRKCFPCHDACTYVFAVDNDTTMQNTSSTLLINQNPAIDEVTPLNVSKLESLASTQLLKVTPAMIRLIRTTLLQRSEKPPSPYARIRR